MSESVTKNLSDAISENEPIEIDIGEEDNETNKEEESNSQKKGRRKTSDVWLYVKRVKVKENGEEIEKYRCNNCPSLFSVPKQGTTSQIKRHVKFCTGLVGKGQKKISFASASSITGTSAIEENYLKTISSGYNQNVVREIMAKMMMVHEYPFNMVEHTWFNILLKVLNPRYERISRNTMRSDVMKVYESAKEEVKLLLKGTYRISLTSDLWTSNQNIGYMSLTAHFVDFDWTLQKRIINFCQLEPPHTGVAISDAIIDCLIAWEIEDKVSTITLDNASANDVAAKTIMNNFQVRDKLYFKGLIFHVRCCAHILNLVVQDGIHVIQDVIENIRCSVTYLKKSPSRMYKFGEIARQLSVPTSKGLALDVATRWNSTYVMLEHAFVYQKVFEQYATRDANYKWLPSEDDWFKAAKVYEYLKNFYDVTQIISGSSYPTANLFLIDLWKVKEALNKGCESEFYFLKDMAIEMRKKFDKYWEECENNRMNDISQLDKSDDLIGAKGSEGQAEFKIFLESTNAVEPLKSELEIYLEEQTTSLIDKFDYLEWWRLNMLKFPILSKMARDILSVPISTVASESAFSAGGRVLNNFRSSLSSETVEALVPAMDNVFVRIPNVV
ncbi:zinc finger BED domain-containing protein RICESLEEPER 2-like [Typha latifolia]|uniref:zinc finger BED domain-containing protein RICESLEEPER 2-like n=1 Tax=Typha latifolia TaxID=4733 RepID=UPI003C2D8D42